MQNLFLAHQACPFYDYLETWLESLPVLTIDQAFPQPDKGAVISVDVINGFCYEGALASPRVATIVQPIVRLFTHAWDHGVHRIVLAQDTHEPEAVEFGAWPAHCVRGTSESEAVPEIKALPFYNQMTTFPKNSIHASLNTELSTWLDDHPDLDTFVVVGDCTDLCTYQLAMHLRLDANSSQVNRRVIVPEDCTDTYDLPVDAALEIGTLPHPADPIHAMFLYHMALNGVEVVKSIVH